MSIKRIDHIAIVVEDLEGALAVYRDALGMAVGRVEPLPEQDVRVAFLPIAEGEIELLEPIRPDSGVARYLARHGEGLHHICLEVDDIEATLARLKAQGVTLINETPVQGAHGRVVFIHPKGARGVLIELLERDSGT